MSFRDAGCSVILLQESLSSVLNRQIHSDTQFMTEELITGESISVCIHSYSNHHCHLRSTRQICHCLDSHQHAYGAQLKVGCYWWGQGGDANLSHFTEGVASVRTK